VCTLASDFTAKRAVSGTYDGRLFVWNLQDGVCETWMQQQHRHDCHLSKHPILHSD